LFQDILLLQPLRIWMRFVVIAAAANTDVRSLHGVLRERARGIMLREKGLIRDADALIQHFNPACRAARAYPELASSRLLLSLNDFDLMAAKFITRPKKNVYNILNAVEDFLFLAFVATLIFLTTMPDVIQDSIVEVNVTSGINIGFVILILLSQQSIVIPVMIVVASLGTLYLRECLEDRRRHHSRQKAIAPIEVKKKMQIIDGKVVEVEEDDEVDELVQMPVRYKESAAASSEANSSAAIDIDRPCAHVKVKNYRTVIQEKLDRKLRGKDSVVTESNIGESIEELLKAATMRDLEVDASNTLVPTKPVLMSPREFVFQDRRDESGTAPPSQDIEDRDLLARGGGDVGGDVVDFGSVTGGRDDVSIISNLDDWTALRKKKKPQLAGKQLASGETYLGPVSDIIMKTWGGHQYATFESPSRPNLGDDASVSSISSGALRPLRVVPPRLVIPAGLPVPLVNNSQATPTDAAATPQGGVPRPRDIEAGPLSPAEALAKARPSEIFSMFATAKSPSPVGGDAGSADSQAGEARPAWNVRVPRRRRKQNNRAYAADGSTMGEGDRDFDSVTSNSVAGPSTASGQEGAFSDISAQPPQFAWSSMSHILGDVEPFEVSTKTHKSEAANAVNQSQREATSAHDDTPDRPKSILKGDPIFSRQSFDVPAKNPTRTSPLYSQSRGQSPVPDSIDVDYHQNQQLERNFTLPGDAKDPLAPAVMPRVDEKPLNVQDLGDEEGEDDVDADD
jgi:hypothetical protein